MKKLLRVSVAVAAICLALSLNAYAGSISAGVSDTELIARASRDGASGINFIDLTSSISGNGWITSFSIYAQSTISASGWSTDYSARQLSLIILRDNGASYMVVGTSPLYTVPAGAENWDQKYTFTLPGNGIQVQAGDRIGWFYPFQGAAYPGPGIAGGVIAFNTLLPAEGGHDVRWTPVWGSGTGIVSGTVPYDGFTEAGSDGYGLGRLYSINVSGADIPVDFSRDCDVDGSDLAALVADTSLMNLATFAQNFGRNVCQ